MGKIIGDAKVIEAAQAVPVGSVASYVNWDAINNLPEMFSGHVVSVPFKPPVGDDDGDFESVGAGSYMLSADLANRVCEQRGIEGCDFGTCEPIYQDIDWNRLTCQFDKPPLMVRQLVGYTSVKQGRILTEDGTMRTCDPCVVSFNAWERCCSDFFGKEESATDYYNPEKVKSYPNGNKYYEYTYYDKKAGKEVIAKKNIQYESRGKRQAAFDEMLKWAQRKSDTKARNLVIRVICGMPTGFRAEELKAGVFYLYRIQKSEFSVKAEQAARLAALSHGIENHTASASLYGNPERPTATPASEPRNVTPVEPVAPAPAAVVEPDPEPEQDAPTVAELAKQADPVVILDQRIELQRVIEHYQKNTLTPETLKDTAKNILLWLKSNAKATEDAVYWPKAIKVMTDIESSVPPEMRIAHGVK